MSVTLKNSLQYCYQYLDCYTKKVLKYCYQYIVCYTKKFCSIVSNTLSVTPKKVLLYCYQYIIRYNKRVLQYCYQGQRNGGMTKQENSPDRETGTSPLYTLFKWNYLTIILRSGYVNTIVIWSDVNKGTAVSRNGSRLAKFWSKSAVRDAEQNFEQFK